ncbi:MAG: 4a-hydroxytetrahydrobiopterin dehydratase [Actinobacteria bacterium]|nr:4a-hydroxytetrahydrobiopterin dehydratase [Actinomycetota bacterium]
MTGTITPQQFHDADGVEDWRVLLRSACTRFDTGSFAAGLELVNAIGGLAEEANHHPDVDLRYGSVTVRLTSHDVGQLSSRDADLARRISEAARERGVAADPGAVSLTEVAVDALDIAAVRPFWLAVLGYGESDAGDLEDPAGHGPTVWFQEMDAPRPGRNRIHIDVAVPHDRADARVAAAVEAGGRVVRDRSPAWVTLADPEGNEACISTWQGRD